MKLKVTVTFNEKDTEHNYECDTYNSTSGFINVVKDGRALAHYNLNAIKFVVCDYDDEAQDAPEGQVPADALQEQQMKLEAD